jgi:hypothetical protein
MRPRKRAAARAGIAVLALTIVGGGIAIGLSLGGSSPVHTSAGNAHAQKSATTSTATTTSPSTTLEVAPNTTTTTVPEKAGASGAITKPTAPTKSTATATPTQPITPTKSTATTTTTKPTTPATTTAAAPSGGNCTSPSFSSSSAEATDNIDPSDGHQYWWVNNDAWSGGHGPQTIDVCSQSSWYAVSNQPNVGGQVETYPSTEYDIGGRSDAAASSSTPISGFSSIDSTFSEAFPSEGGWDAGYDLWTDDWKNETMIWNQWAGSNDFWPKKATIAVTLGGVGYTFYPNCNGPADPANEAHCEYMFFRDTQVTSGSVNILAAWQWEVANGYASASDIPTQLEYGVEVSYTSGTETFPMTGLTFAVS